MRDLTDVQAALKSHEIELPVISPLANPVV
jgi:hypothetical protein